MPMNFKPLRKLQWQLSLSYTLVAVSALLVVEFILLAGIVFIINSDAISTLLVRALRAQMGSQLRPFLDRSEPDIAGMHALLNTYAQPEMTGEVDEFAQTQLWSVESASENMLVLDPEGVLLWAQYLPAGSAYQNPFPPELIPGLPQVLPAALANQPDPSRLFTRQGTKLVMAVPLTDSSGERVLGVSVFLLNMPTVTDPSFILPLLPTILASIAGFTLAAGLMGSVFGYFVARRFTRRLEQVSQAADAWSRGDFHTFIRDSHGDELGEMARRLNTMAEQLQNLMDTRQDLAALEERNRIARDLHDSVKQQVFATAMQLGAARALLPDDETGPVAQRLSEAEQLTRQAQSELTTLIHELRPVALEGKGLARALHELVKEWSRQSGIAAQFVCPNEVSLPLLKEQAVFRVVQEALANAARHSQAHAITVQLSQRDGVTRLEIEDDGRGFDPAALGSARGIGLRSMRERVESLGGQMAVRSAPQQGTRLVVTIPTQQVSHE